MQEKAVTGTAEQGLSVKQKRFVSEYLVDLNATRAAKAAGYSEKTASTSGPRLLANVRVQAEIQRQLEAARTEKVAEATEVLEYLTAVMRGRITQGAGD